MRAGPRTRRPSVAQAVVARLHLYGGLFVAPLLVVAALTGVAYVWTPQLDAVVHAELLRAPDPEGFRLPLYEQVSTAQTAFPDARVSAVLPGDSNSDTTRVVLLDPALPDDLQRTVHVDPWSGKVRGELATWFGRSPSTTWLAGLHRDLHLGSTGRHYSETAASWLGVLVLSGIWLWVRHLALGRSAHRLRRAVLPERGARRVRRLRSWHAVLGVWAAVALLGLSVTGLTWSRYAGTHFNEALTALDGRAPVLDVTSGPGSGGAHGEHQAVDAGAGAAAGSASGHGHHPVPIASYDQVLAAAQGAGLSERLTLTPPSSVRGLWTVAEDDTTWPLHLDKATVDGETGEVVQVLRFSEWPLLAQVSKLGISAHEGELLGIVNQVALTAVGLGLVALLVLGGAMWWKRRGSRAAPLSREALHPRSLAAGAVLLAVVAAVCWVLPLLGITLVAFAIGDVALAGARRVRQPATS